jgi:hypothetical protein
MPAVFMAYGIVLIPSYERAAEDSRLRLAYPIESMNDRVPEPVWKRPPERSDFPSTDRIDEAVKDTEHVFDLRKYALKSLHSGTVDRFGSAMGFGVGRMIREVDPSAKILKLKRDDGRPDLPGHKSSADDISESVKIGDSSSSIGSLHETGVINFVNPAGFGLVESRGKVIGFVPHSFNEVPESKSEWKTAS